MRDVNWVTYLRCGCIFGGRGVLTEFYCNSFQVKVVVSIEIQDDNQINNNRYQKSSYVQSSYNKI